MDTPLEHAWHVMGKLEKLMPAHTHEQALSIVHMLHEETILRDAQITDGLPNISPVPKCQAIRKSGVQCVNVATKLAQFPGEGSKMISLCAYCFADEKEWTVDGQCLVKS